MGGYGCFTATCAVLPEYMSAIYRLWKEGDHERALFLQKKMVPVARAMMQAMPFPAGFKLALEVRGYAMGAPKLPFGRRRDRRTRRGRCQAEGHDRRPSGASVALSRTSS